MNAVKYSRKSGTMTNNSRSGRPRKVGQRVKLEDVIPHALAHLQSSTSQMTEECGHENVTHLDYE